MWLSKISTLKEFSALFRMVCVVMQQMQKAVLFKSNRKDNKVILGLLIPRVVAVTEIGILF